jgi:hypothetical protein
LGSLIGASISASRQPNTDDAEVLFKAARPTILNGIEDVIGRPDLADRAIFLTLDPIGSAFLSAYASIPDKEIGVHSAQSFPKRCLRAPA